MIEQPDILWIVTTQWRAQACGYAGDPNARTPNLDALAAQSTNYAEAVTPHPFGPFARAAMLTGIPSPENGVREYFDPLPPYAGERRGGSPSAQGRTIAHALGERGYRTGFLGKWHLAKRDPQAALVGEAHAKTLVPPEGRGGFEFWEGFEGGFLLNDPWLHGSELPQPQPFPGYQSDVVCHRAAEWVGTAMSQGERRSPWFCVVSLEAPHPPYDAAAGGVLPWDPREIILPVNVPRGGEAEGKARRELAGYYAHIAATDRAVGTLVSAVDRAASRSGAMAPNIVFTSVHGDMHGAHGLFRKGWPYEESVRVPLLVRSPDRSTAGRTSDAAVSLLALPTLALAWADGNLFKAESATSARISMPSVVALPFQCDRVWAGIRTKRRKLVVNPDGSPWLFFDLEHDPEEMVNLAADAKHKGDIEALRSEGDLIGRDPCSRGL
ncbi:MAG: hypothetical protein RIQ93_565 [Verrucomicrobiota bacterium]